MLAFNSSLPWLADLLFRVMRSSTKAVRLRGRLPRVSPAVTCRFKNRHQARPMRVPPDARGSVTGEAARLQPLAEFKEVQPDTAAHSGGSR